MNDPIICPFKNPSQHSGQVYNHDGVWISPGFTAYDGETGWWRLSENGEWEHVSKSAALND